MRLNPQRIKIITCDRVAPRWRGVVTSADCYESRSEGSEVLEAPIAIALIDIVGIRLESPAVAIDSVEALDARHIQRPQNQRIQYAKDNGVCADTQCERHDGNRCKSGRL